VESRREADRVWKREIPNLGGKDRIIGAGHQGPRKAELERPDGGAVGAFRIKEKQRRSSEFVQEIGHYDLSNSGDTICSTAAAIANSLRSAPCSPTSITPTGASPARWQGIEIAQRSSTLAIVVLRSTNRLTSRKRSAASREASDGATIGTVGMII